MHGLASLLVEGGLRLGAAERESAQARVRRMLLLGLGVSPELVGPPPAGGQAELRPEEGRRRARP